MIRPFDEFFSQVPDPRNGNAKRHYLSDIIGLCVIALLCRVEGWEQVEMFGKGKEKFLRQILHLPHGIPSHDTLERVFRRIDPPKLEDCFRAWALSLRAKLGGEVIAIDGKSLRGTRQDGAGRENLLHLVSVWVTGLGIALAQEAVDGKENEQKAIRRLLEVLDLCGCTLTMDAMGNHREIAAKIVDSNSQYVCALKENQPTILEETEALFNSIGPESSHTWYDKGHGRIEKRTCEVIYKVDMLDPIHNWPGLKALIKISSERTAGGKSSSETRYYLSSRLEDAKTFNEIVRSHWSIENGQHWVLDVTFDEDRCRKRKDNSAKNYALLRRIALNILNQDPTPRMTIPKKRLKATIDEEYLVKLLGFI